MPRREPRLLCCLRHGDVLLIGQPRSFKESILGEYSGFSRQRGLLRGLLPGRVRIRRWYNASEAFP